MITTLKLVYGGSKRYPPRNPSRTLDLNQADKNLAMMLGGFAPGPGGQQVVWSGGTLRREGQDRIDSTRDNAVFELVYQLRGSSVAQLAYWQREIGRVALDVRDYEERAQGEPVWLMYLMESALADLPAPVFGQMYHYQRVLDINVPSWPDSLHAGALQSDNAILGMVAALTCGPVAKGLQQSAGVGIGQLEIDPHKGVLMAMALTNLVTNAEFAHGTWDNDWTASDADLVAYQETRPGFTLSHDSAAHLINQGTAVHQFTQTQTLGDGIKSISAMVRRPDGADPSADFQFWGQAAALGTPTTDQIDGGPWYHCHDTYDAVAVSSSHGLQVAVGSEIIVDNVQIAAAALLDPASRPAPFCAGTEIGCDWVSAAYDSSLRTAGTLRWDLDDELAGEFTVAGWIQPGYPVAGVMQEHTLWQYYVDATDNITCQIDIIGGPGTARFEVVGDRDGAAFALNGSSLSFDAYDKMHVAVVHVDGTLTMYVNGAADGSTALPLGYSTGGTLCLGFSVEEEQALNGYLDGWRIWREGLTATQVSDLYDAELPVKQDHGVIGMPPFIWTKDGDAEIDAVSGDVSGTASHNYAILGGVSGDMPAEVEWRIDLDTAEAPRVVWMGRKAVTEPFASPRTLWLEYDGTSDTGNSSGDAYEQGTTSGSGSDTHDFDMTMNEIEVIRGHVQVLGRFRAIGQNYDVAPYFRLGASDRAYGDTLTGGTASAMQLRDFGDFEIDWPQANVPPTMVAGLMVTEAVATAGTVRLDFIQLLPEPSCRVECESGSGGTVTLASGDTLVVDGWEAWMEDASDDDSQLQRWMHTGDEVTLKPNEYNYVYFVLGEEDTAYTVTRSATVAAKVTPRYTLPGGVIA